MFKTMAAITVFLISLSVVISGSVSTERNLQNSSTETSEAHTQYIGNVDMGGM